MWFISSSLYSRGVWYTSGTWVWSQGNDFIQSYLSWYTLAILQEPWPLPKDMTCVIWTDGGWWKGHFLVFLITWRKKLLILYNPSPAAVSSDTCWKPIISEVFPLGHALWNGLPRLTLLGAFHPRFYRGGSWVSGGSTTRQALRASTQLPWQARPVCLPRLFLSSLLCWPNRGWGSFRTLVEWREATEKQVVPEHSLCARHCTKC